MSLKQEIEVLINDSKALKDIHQIEAEIKKLKNLGETGIRMTFDKDNGLLRVFSKLKADGGAIIEVVRTWNAETQMLERSSSNVAINFEKAAKEEEKAAKKSQQEYLKSTEAKMQNLEAFMRLRAKADEDEIKAIERKMQNQEAYMRLREKTASDIERLTSKATSAWASGDIKGYNAAIQELKKYGVVADEAAIKSKALGDAASNAGRKAETSSKGFTILYSVLMRLAHTAISAVTRSFREALTEMKNVDSALVVVRKVSDASSAELLALKERAYEVGAAYGVLASDYLNAAAEMTRAGYREQAGDLAELATKLQLVGDVSQDVANQFLIATDKSYKMNGNYQKLSETIDKLNEIDNNFATSFEKVADGIGLLAPVAAQANVSFDEMAAAIGTVTAVTQRSGTEAARALRSLFINILKDTTTEIDEGVTWTVDEINSLSDALKKYAPEVVKAAEATGELINPMEALGALAQSYKDGLLTNQDLFEITSGLGGKLRTSQLLALVQNWDMYNQMLEKTADAAGSADKEVQNALDSWEVKLNQLKNTFTDFVQKSLSTDLIKGLIDGLNWLVSGVGNLGNALRILGGILLAIKLPSILATLTKLRTGFTNFLGSFTSFIAATGSGVRATDAFSTAFHGLSLSASVAQIAIGLVVAAISIYTIAANKAKQAEEERRSKQIEAARTAAQEASELQKLKNNYDELRKSFEDGKIKREDYETAQQAIIDKLKAEGFWADDTAVKYNKLTEAIEAQTKAALESRKAEILTGLRGARSAVDDALYADTVIKLNIDESIDKAITWLSKGGMGGNIPSWILTGIDSLGLSPYDRLRDQTGSLRKDVVFGSDEETRVLRAIELYYTLKDALVALSEAGKDETDEFKFVGDAIGTLEPEVKEYVDTAYELFDILDENELSEYESRGGIWGYLIGKYREGKPTVDTVKDEADETAESIKGLSDELKNATAALDKYKKALEGGEKGDSLKSYAEAYKKAVEMYEKGLTGSNQYMSAIDLLFGNVDDYEAAGKLLGNAFVKAMFEGGGEDYGANAANYIRKHLDEFKGVSIEEGEDGTFSLMITDMEKFAESTGLTADALWTLIDALDIFDSKTTYTRDQLFNFMGLDDNGLGGIVNLTDTINKLAEQGKSAREIKDIVDLIKELAKTDGNIEINEPENLDQTIEDILELNKQAEKGTEFEVVITSNKDEFFGGIYEEIKNLDGTTIYIGLATKGNNISEKDVFKFWQVEHHASGTKSARGGLSLVNEEGAELIYANGKAWIAGGGDPAITNLPAGAGVFTAKETREILTRSGIESHRGTYVGGIPINDIIASGGSGKSGKGKLTEDLLQQIADYINDILKKAKEALQEQLDAIDEQIEKLKREHDAEEDANKLEELRLKILEAEKKLAEAEQERTVRYFNKETGQWEWMADQKAVADAQKELQDARDAYDKEVAEQAYQAQLQALEDQKDSLNDAYNELSDGWEKIYEELENILNEKGAVDIAKLLATLLGTQGGGYAPDIQALIDAIGAFTANPTSVLDTDTTERIMSLNSSSGGATPVLSAMLGSGSYDLNGRGQSTLGGNTSIVGDTIYYINGVQIGSDMMDKPLSQILSVLPIYAN